MLSSVLDIVKDGFEVTQKATSEVSDAIKDIKEYPEKKLEELQEYKEEKAKKILNVSEKISSEISDAIDNITDYPERKIEELNKYTEGQVKEIEGYLKEKVNDVEEYVEKKIDKVENYAENKIKEAADKITEKIKNVEDKAIGKVKEVADKLIKKLDKKAKLVESKVKEINGLAQKIFNELKNLLAKKLNELKEGIVNEIKELKDLIVGKINELKDFALKKVKELKDLAIAKIKELKDEVDKKIDEVKNYALEKINEGYDATKGALSDLKDGILQLCPGVVNSVVNVVAQGLSYLPGTPLYPLLDKILSLVGKDNTVDKSWDGKYINCATQVPSNTPVSTKPTGCKATSLPKTYYINGIKTEPLGNCTSSQKLANAICSEVVSIYNRTEGMLGDVQECIENIKKTGQSPPTRAMIKMLSDRQPGEKTTIYAHSQGGLVTQDALANYKITLTKSKEDGGLGLSEEEAEQEMSNIKVVSLGTAEDGWPKGPQYEQYTNSYDPIPIAIKGAQNSLRVKKVALETLTTGLKILKNPFNVFEEIEDLGKRLYEDEATINPAMKHTVDIPNLNPIDSHNIDDLYLEEVIKQNAQSKQCVCK